MSTLSDAYIAPHHMPVLAWWYVSVSPGCNAVVMTARQSTMELFWNDHASSASICHVFPRGSVIVSGAVVPPTANAAHTVAPSCA